METENTEKFLERLLNLPRREFMVDPSACAYYIERTKKLCSYLGNPQNKFKFIHVAGTCGKGSTVKMIEKILTVAGFNCGSYTSPHITSITDRFSYKCKNAKMSELNAITKKIKIALQKYTENETLEIPSYFEIDTVLALLFFESKGAKWIVLETGCGGRYDSTNIIPAPEIAIITNIGLDHTDILGNTKEKIAYEKIGIVKPGCKVIIGEKNEKIKNLLVKNAQKQGAKKIICVNKLYKDSVGAYGEHQKINAAVAATCAKELGINSQKIKMALAKIKIPATFEFVSKKPIIIIDGAHNPDKLKTTADSLIKFKAELIKKGLTPKIHLIFGMSQNKNLSECLTNIALVADYFYATRFTINPFRKCADPRIIGTAIKETLKNKKINLHEYLFPEDAFAAACKNATSNDVVIVTGSIFLAGELRPLAIHKN